jgi:hypothetical protein
MTRRLMVLLAMLAGAGLACSTESASLHKTAQMTANMSAKADGSGSTTVTASLQLANSLLTFIELTADDQLTASLAGDTRAMSQTSILGYVGYSASFNQDGDGEEFHVKLSRKLDSGAPDSYVDLPASFTIGALAQPSYSRGSDAIVIDWTSTSSLDPMTLDVSASCLQSYHQDLGTMAGSATIPAGALKKATASGSTQVPDECDGTITLVRTQQGKVDPTFSGGTFTGTQSRTVDFHTKP